MTAAFLLPHLVLPRNENDQDESVNKTLSGRIESWIKCDLDSLFNEAKAVQERIQKATTSYKFDPLKEFDKHMHSGKLSNALQCLSNNNKGGVLNLNEKIGHESVHDILKEKHPAPNNNLYSSYVINHSEFQTLAYHPAIFEKIYASMIRRAAMKTHGSHGPSGLDANEWRRILTTFKSSSTDLCKTIARLAVKVATERLTFLESYN